MAAHLQPSSNVFPLRHLAATCAAKLNFDITHLPNELQEYVVKIKNIFNSDSIITLDVFLYDNLSLKVCDPHVLPQYSFDFPLGLDVYASVKNETSGIECCGVDVTFSHLPLKFHSSSNVSVANILDFISDISGAELLLPDIIIDNIHVDTNVVVPDGVFSITHNYTGWLSNLHSTLQSFKNKTITSLSHSQLSHSSLSCVDVWFDRFATWQLKNN